MNAEFIIHEDADNFTRGINRMYSLNEQDQFISKLSIKLSNYYEDLDQLIFLYRVHKNIGDKYEKHLLTCKFKDELLRCPENRFYEKMIFFTEQEIKSLNPSFEYSILRPDVNSNIIKQNLVELKNFPNASKQYLQAINKLNEGRFERNLLDDLRLALEYLLKALLKNEKPLEKQFEELGKFLKQRNTSKEVTNMFLTLIDYYSKYQNSYVKHNDEIKKDEIDLLINLTSSFINFIISK